MAKQVALLRGVNVGGNTLRMERLRELWSELGFAHTRTYVQSGNVVFEAAGTAKQCAALIEKKLAGETRLPVSVFLRSPTQLARLVELNPFLRDRAVDRGKLHVTFLADAPKKDAWQKLDQLDAGADRYHATAQEVYLYCPNGYGRSKLVNNTLERILGVKATTRNWNTIQKLAEMAGQAAE